MIVSLSTKNKINIELCKMRQYNLNYAEGMFMEKLGRYIKPYIWYIMLTIGIKLLATILDLMIPFFMEIILDDVVPTGDLISIFRYAD